MSDRGLPEVLRSYPQTIKAILGRLTRLELRAWPGAVRSAHLASFDAMDSIPQTVLSLSLTSGRWIIFHRGYCTLVAANPGAFVNMRSSTPDQQVARTPFFAGWAIGSSNLPFSDFGEITATDVTTVNLEVYGAGFEESQWTSLSLLAFPV